MPQTITLNINGQQYTVSVEPDTPLLYVLRGELGLKSAKYGCGLEQCGTCKVLIDGNDVPSCQLPVSRVEGLEITTLEGLAPGDELHPLQETFLEEQAAQCGFCTAGMIVTAQGLLNRTRYPSDEDIRTAFEHNLCRCGVYDRVRRAIKLRIGRPEANSIYELIEPTPLPHQPDSELPRSIQSAPKLKAWLQINDDETVTIFSGKVELGQGIKTALAQIASEELDVAVNRIQVKTADTGATPNEGGTTGSMSLQMSGASIRVACAQARHQLLQLAFEHLESMTPANELTIDDGTIIDPISKRQTTYWELMGSKPFEQDISGQIAPKNPATYSVIGQPEKRIDLLDKMTGKPAYVHDLDFPAMLHARVLRSAGLLCKITIIGY